MAPRSVLSQLGVLPEPGAAVEEFERWMEAGGRKAIPNHAPLSKDPNAYVNHPDIVHKIEQIPIAWLDKLDHDFFNSDFEDRLSDMHLERQINGVSRPAVIRAGTQSRNAILSEGMEQVEAAKRAGHTHYPAVVVLAPQGGRGFRGTTHLEKDIVPHHVHRLGEGYRPMNMTVRPSEAFTSLKEHPQGATSGAAATVEARKAQRGGTHAWHGTKESYDEFLDPNRPDRPDRGFMAADRMMGTHFAAAPETSAIFAKDWNDPYRGEVKAMTLPPPGQLYEMEQTTDPDRRLALGLRPGELSHKGMEGDDTRHMNAWIGEWGLMNNKPAIEDFLRYSFNIDDRDRASQMADDLMKGYRVGTRHSQPRTLWEMLQTGSIQSLPEETLQGVINNARQNLEKWGFKGGSYLNTVESMPDKDPTSYIVWNPKDFKYRFQTDPVGNQLHNWFDPMGQASYETAYDPRFKQQQAPKSVEDILGSVIWGRGTP